MAVDQGQSLYRHTGWLTCELSAHAYIHQAIRTQPDSDTTRHAGYVKRNKKCCATEMCTELESEGGGGLGGGG